MEYDLHSKVNVVTAIAPVALAATTNGDAIDTLDYESLEYLVVIGTAFVGGGFDITLEQSPDDGSGSPTGVWTAVPDADIVGQLSATIAVQVVITDADTVFRAGSIGKERHQRCVLTETGTISAGVIGVVGLLSNPKRHPVADQNLT